MKEQTQALEHASVKQYCKALRVPMIGAHFVQLAEQAIPHGRSGDRAEVPRELTLPLEHCAERQLHGSPAVTHGNLRVTVPTSGQDRSARSVSTPRTQRSFRSQQQPSRRSRPGGEFADRLAGETAAAP